MSGKLQFLLALLARLNTEGHRVLIFSQSRTMLDMIQSVIVSKYSVLRLDGTIKETSERQALLDKFNGDPSVFAFLLTTQVAYFLLALFFTHKLGKNNFPPRE